MGCEDDFKQLADIVEREMPAALVVFIKTLCPKFCGQKILFIFTFPVQLQKK